MELLEVEAVQLILGGGWGGGWNTYAHRKTHTNTHSSTIINIWVVRDITHALAGHSSYDPGAALGGWVVYSNFYLILNFTSVTDIKLLILVISDDTARFCATHGASPPTMATLESRVGVHS